MKNKSKKILTLVVLSLVFLFASFVFVRDFLAMRNIFQTVEPVTAIVLEVEEITSLDSCSGSTQSRRRARRGCGFEVIGQTIAGTRHQTLLSLAIIDEDGSTFLDDTYIGLDYPKIEVGDEVEVVLVSEIYIRSLNFEYRVYYLNNPNYYYSHFPRRNWFAIFVFIFVPILGARVVKSRDKEYNSIN